MKIYFYFIILFLFSCKNENSKTIENQTIIKDKVVLIDSLENQIIDTLNTIENQAKTQILNDSIIKRTPKIINTTEIDTNFVKLSDLSSEFVFDIKYATNDNFLKQKVYDCPECYLRLKTAKAIINANQEFIKIGYRLKVFDCYRPHDVQKKMWEILPETHYVANPKRGSIHNRGGAIDVTLIDKNGNELDMGTHFDFFGKEAHHTYTKHSATVQNNRNILKNTLKKHGFRSIYSEWWHYETIGARSEKISNFKWDCE